VPLWVVRIPGEMGTPSAGEIVPQRSPQS